ncbi:PKD domain-containing protein [Bradyrhizobium lablabi]|uniref:PKD domain-containing protein n=1 Tax=Bradyrhizobium lablabi TaxID=722472 RepID=UPI001BAD0E59|nr:PKD domain-containing protein [Bradyrhizobium lablabi]MBR0696739.1 PKD domain-containing protein [Bradyrhizobium lablabi]
MPDTKGFSVVVEAGREVLRKAFRGAWKSALCPEDPGDSGRIPENLDVTQADGMTFGPYEIVDAQVQIPREELDATLAPDIDGAELKLGLHIQAEIKDPPVPSARLFDFRAEARAKAPIAVPANENAVYFMLGALQRGNVAVSLPDGDPLANKIDLLLGDYVHMLYEDDGSAFPHSIAEANKQWPLGLFTATVDVYAELYDDQNDPSRRINVTRPLPDQLKISIPLYMRISNIRPPAALALIEQPFGIETRFNLIAPFSMPPGHIVAALSEATVEVEPLQPAGAVHDQEGPNYAAIPGIIKTALDNQLIKGIADTALAMAHEMRNRDIAVPTSDQIQSAIGDLFFDELKARDDISVWTPIATPEINLNIDNVASRVHTDFLAIGINADAGADIGGLTNFIPAAQEFAIGINADQMNAAIAVARENGGLADADLPKRIESGDDKVDLNSLNVFLVDSAIRIEGEVTVIDAILGSIDVDADFRSDIGLEWVDDADGTQRIEHVKLGEPEIDPEESVLFWVIALIIGILTGGIGGGIIALIVLVIIKLVVDQIAQSIGAEVVTDKISGQVVGLGGWPSRLSRIGRVTTRFANPIIVDTSGLTLAGSVEVISSCEATAIAFAKTNGSFTASASSPLTMNAGRTHADALYSWSPGDGTPQATVQNLTHVYTASGLYIAKHGLVMNQPGGASTRHFAAVRIANVAPTADAGPDIVAKEGEVVTLTGRFWDVEPTDSHETSWIFGDNQPPQRGTVSETHTPPRGFGTSTVTHAWCDNGTYTVLFTVRDQNGGIAQDTTTVTVLNVAPEVEAGPDMFAYAGSPLLLCAHFRDPGWCDMHTATWDPGVCIGEQTAVVREINTPPAARGTASLAHAYTGCGVYHAVCRVTDDDGSSGEDGLVVRVVAIQNDGFEGGYRDLPLGRVANGWQPYGLASRKPFDTLSTKAAARAVLGTPKAAVFDCEECVVHDGQRSQRIMPIADTRWGIYQHLGANPGWLYQVAAWFTLATPGSARLGIDPAGGTDPAAGHIVWAQGSTPGDWFQLREQVKALGELITIFLEADLPTDKEDLVCCVDDVSFVAMACDCCCEPEGGARKTECRCCGNEPKPSPSDPERRCMDFSQVTPRDEHNAKVKISGFTVASPSESPLHFVIGDPVIRAGLLLVPGGIEIAFPFKADKAIASVFYRGGKPPALDARDGSGIVINRVVGDPARQGMQTLTIEAPEIFGLVISGQESVLVELCIESPQREESQKKGTRRWTIPPQ